MYIYIGSFIVITALILYVMRPRITTIVQTKREKREEIVDGYKKQLREALEVIHDNDEKTVKKVALLKKFSDELASNIFFDSSEIHEIILELSKED
ncbi:MAG: hypothetical protein PHX13_00635 [Thiovulaceae bacterium]|nr:hypothetical protein [Sulfurimonadaceae bacterium]